MSLTRREIGKDVVEQSIDAAIATTGRVVAILFAAGQGIARELGGFATEIFEIAEASKRAESDTDHSSPTHPVAD
ncbi:hypothetical protein [Aeromicrobium alkaliterrae]|uniref:Uncharacterized protein n=1 Tax=Aeromicrobium alkaliterrae TaxID=302168 RepID=A0ABN2JQ15_9ACTN